MAQLDLEDPLWTEHWINCMSCRTQHRITPQPRVRAHDRQSGRATFGASGRYCEHGTSSPEIWLNCAFCDADMHVHQDGMAGLRAKPDGFLIQSCPACHRANAVLPTRLPGAKGAKAERLDNGAPVSQRRMF